MVTSWDASLGSKTKGFVQSMRAQSTAGALFALWFAGALLWSAKGAAGAHRAGKPLARHLKTLQACRFRFGSRSVGSHRPSRLTASFATELRGSSAFIIGSKAVT